MQAVTHFLVPALIVAFFRDYYLRKRSREEFSLHYVWIAGIAGILPDIDFAFYFLLRLLGYDISLMEVHQPYTHLVIIPLILLLFGFVFSSGKLKFKVCNIRKHKLKVNWVFYVVAFGYLIHIILDSFDYVSQPLAPFSHRAVGLSLASYLGIDPGFFGALIDGIIFLLWVTYLELKHKISDFI